MPLKLLLFPGIFVIVLGTIASAQGDNSLWTSWISIAVRSPYLSIWMNATHVPLNTSNVDGALRAPTVWPQSLQNQHYSLTGFIRIDNHTIAWLGDPEDSPDFDRSILTNIEMTPTRTIMNVTAGPLDLVVTFLSPIEPADPVAQSLPFSYISLEATSNDRQQHHVQVYFDISGELLSGDRSQMMTWSTHATDAVLAYQMSLQNPQSMTEIADQIEDGTVFFAMPALPSQTYMVGISVNCRFPFLETGVLNNQSISSPTPISTPWPVFAISVDLGTITSFSEPLVWTVGMTRDPAIQSIGTDNSPQSRSPYWASKFNEPLDAAAYFVADYHNALARAVSLDHDILTAAGKISAHYADLVSLAARQTMGGIELTIGRNTTDLESAQWDSSDVKMFMKNLGTDGRINPVEGLYQAFPFFMYLNATYCGWLLEPVLEFANSGLWTFPYAPRDIGINYPNATGNILSHNQGVEQSGNMLIMTLAHARATGDGTLIGRYYDLHKKWADYLVDNAFPLEASQQSADMTDTKSNLTNLALKGIIGIQAMAEMSSAMNLSNDHRHYSSTAASLASLWQSQAVSSDGQHILTSFGDPDNSLALTYNLFADKLLSTNLVPSNLYTAQTESLKALVSESSDQCGLPIDQNLSSQANSVWSLFTAAYSTDPGVRDSIIDQIWGRVSSNATDIGIFSTAYSLNKTLAPIDNNASPFIGGVFAPLSLNVQNVTINVPTNLSSTSTPTSSGISSSTPIDHPFDTLKGSSNTVAIAGGVIGGIGGAVILCALVLYRRRRRSRRVSFQTQAVPFAHETPPDLSSMTETSVRGPGMTTAKEQQTMLSGRSASEPNPPAITSSSNATAPGQNPFVAATAVPTADTARSQPDDRLRREIENLVRVVQTLQEARYEPPPDYESELRA